MKTLTTSSRRNGTTKASKQKWEYLGECGVDSGQLMVCDPCYIESEWRESPEDLCLHPVYKDTSSGQRWAYDRADTAQGIKQFPGCYADPIPECGGLDPNKLIEIGQWVQEPDPEPSGEFSYQGCCEATKGGVNRDSGQLIYKMGHAGAGVVFSSGYGDGCYPVYGRRNKEGRIIEVRIKMG